MTIAGKSGGRDHRGKDGKPRGNPVRGVRIEGDLWAAVKAKADAEGRTRNSVIVELLRAYVDGRLKR